MSHDSVLSDALGATTLDTSEVLSSLNRRTFLVASGLASAGIATAQDSLAPTLVVAWVDGGDALPALLITLGTRHWRITPFLFGSLARLTHGHDTANNIHRLTLKNAYFPGTSLNADFSARIFYDQATWKIELVFALCGKVQRFMLTDWMSGEGERGLYNAQVRSSRAIIRIGQDGARLEAAEGKLGVTIDAALTFGLTGAAGLTLHVAPLTLLLSAARFAAAPLPSKPLPVAVDGAVTSITCAHVGSARAEIALCRIGSAQHAKLTSIARPVLSVTGFNRRGRRDAAVELSAHSEDLIPAGALEVSHRGGAGDAVRLQLATWKIAGMLSSFASTRMFTAELFQSASGCGVEADVCTLVVNPLPGSGFAFTISEHGLAQLAVDAQLLGAHVPVAGASAAALTFGSGTLVHMTFGGKPIARTNACAVTWHVSRQGSDLLVPLDKARLALRRSADGFDLAFEFRNYELRVNDQGARIAERWSYEGACGTAAAWPRLLVFFHPQHEFEEVFATLPLAEVTKPFPEDKPPEDKPVPPTDKTRLAVPVRRRHLEQWLSPTGAVGPDLARTRLAGQSRLVFQVRAKLDLPRSKESVALTIEWITDWSGMDLMVNPRALKRNATLQEQLDIANIKPRDPRRQALEKVRALVHGSIDGQPDDEETAIEPIYRMVVSPDAAATFSVPRHAPDPAMPVLWSAVLDNPDSVAVRAIAARGTDYGYLGRHGDYQIPAFDRAFAGPLTANDLRELVGMQSVFGLAALRRLMPNLTPGRKSLFQSLVDKVRGADNGNEQWRDDPNGMVFMPSEKYDYLDANPATMEGILPERAHIPHEGVMLARPFERFKLRLGRAADVDAFWKGEPPAGYISAEQGPFFTPAFTVERYTHRTVQGRDAFVEVVYKGFLFPLGLRAALVKVTRRDFRRYHMNPRGAPTAYLIQEMFIVVNKPRKTFKAYGQPNEGRDFPCASITMLTTQTGSLGDPEAFFEKAILSKDETRPYPPEVGTVFWPKHAGADKRDVIFSWQVDDQSEPARSHLLFVDNAAAHDPATMQLVIEQYNQRSDKRDVEHHGAVRRYAAENRPGETSFKTRRWTLSAQGRLNNGNGTAFYHMDAFMEGQDQPPFYPVLESAEMMIETIERFTGKPNTPILAAFNQQYIRYGFDSARNPTELYLNVVKPDLEMNANDSQGAGGGIAGMAMLVAGLSRRIGPVGGRRNRPAAPTGSSGPRVRQAVPDSGIDMGEAQSGRMNADQFFDGAVGKAKLFGIMRISALLKALLIAAAPKLIETVNYAVGKGQGMIEDFAAKLGAAIGTVRSALISARAEIDRGLASMSDAGVPLTLRGLYGGFAQSLDLLEAALAQAEAATTHPAPSLVVLEAAANRLKAGVDGVRREMESIARDPVPTMVKQAIGELQRQWEAIRAPFSNIDAVIDAVVKGVIDEALQDLLKAACKQTNGIDVLPVLLGEDLHAPGGTVDCGARIDAVQKLMRNPADALPRLRTALLYEVFSGPLLKVLQGLGGAHDQARLLWSREAIADALTQILLKGAPHVSPVDIVESVNQGLVKLEQALGALPADGDAVLPFIEKAARASLGDVVTMAKQQLDLLEGKLQVEIRTVQDGIRRHLVKEAGRLITPTMRAEYETLVIELHRVHGLADEVKVLIDLLSSSGERERVFKLLVQAVEDEFRRALSDQLEQARKKAQDVATDISDRLLDMARDLFEMLLKWQGMKELRQLADTVNHGADKAQAGLDAVCDTLFARIADVSALHEQVDAGLLKIAGLLDGVSGDARDKAAPMNAAVRAALARSVTVRAELVRLNVLLEQRGPTAALRADLLLANQIVRLRVHIAEGCAALLQQVGGLGSALGAALASSATEWNMVLDEVRFAFLPALRAGTRMLVGLSIAHIRTVSTIPTEWNALQRYIDELAISPDWKNIDGVLDGVKADLDRVEAIVTSDFIAAVKLAENIRGLIDRDLKLLQQRLLAWLAQAMLPGAAFLEQIEAAVVVVCGHAHKMLAEPHMKVKDAVDWLIKFLAPESVKNEPGAAALLALLAQTTSQRLRDVSMALSSDLTLIEQLIKTPADRQHALTELLQRWHDGSSGLQRAVELVNGIVKMITSGNLGALFDVAALERALAESVRSFIPSRISLDYAFDAELSSYPAGDPIFSMDRASYGSSREDAFLEKMPPPVNDLVLRTQVNVDLLSGERKVSSDGYLRPFALHLLGGRLDLLTIYFSGARFHAAPGDALRFSTEIADVKIGAMLSFLTQLQKYFSSGQGNGVYYQLRFGPPEIEVGYRFAKPLIMIGTLQVINLGFHVGAKLPLEDRQAEFFASVSTRPMPFMLAQPPYGGAGFLGLRATAAGVIAFEIQLEFGFVGAMEMGPLNAQARATVGIYLRSGGGRRVLEGFVNVVGSGSLGCFGVAVNIEIRTRQEDGGDMAGSATYEYSFKVGFVEVDFQVHTGHRQQGGSGESRRPADSKPDLAGVTFQRSRGRAKGALQRAAGESSLLKSAVIDKYARWDKYCQYLDLK